MEDIDKKMQKRYNMINEDIVNIAKEEKEKNRINIRKKKIQNLMMRKRYFEIYSNNGFNTNKKNDNNKNIKNSDYIIDISSFLIKEELKKKETIQKILLEKDYKTIFEYINEIYKEKNFQIDYLKYGLFLLNEKLLKYTNNENQWNHINNEENSKIIDELIKNNIKDIILKLLSFSMNEIKKKDNDDIILNLAYQILVNYSYLANEHQLSFLINDNLLNFHLFFLKYSSEEQNLLNIMRMIFNICLDNNINLNNIFIYNNNELINLLNDYISSGVKTNKYFIVEKILNIYGAYLDFIKMNFKDKKEDINLKIIEEIYLTTLQSIFMNNKKVYSYSIFVIGLIYKILFISNNINTLSEFILKYDNTKSMVRYILDFDYQFAGEDINDFCKIIYYIIKCESYSNDLTTKKQLEKFIKEINSNNINGDDIIIAITSLFQRNYTSKITSKLINVLIAFCDSETFHITLFENLSNPILILINNINCREYKIRKKVLIALEKLTEKHELKINNELVRLQIFNELKYIIDPDNSYCRDIDMIITCLNIIYHLLVVGGIIKSFGGKNNILETFENYGGKEVLEKLLNHKNKNIHDKALALINEYFNDKEE